METVMKTAYVVKDGDNLKLVMSSGGYNYFAELDDIERIIEEWRQSIKQAEFVLNLLRLQNETNN